MKKLFVVVFVLACCLAVSASASQRVQSGTTPETAGEITVGETWVTTAEEEQPAYLRLTTRNQACRYEMKTNNMSIDLHGYTCTLYVTDENGVRQGSVQLSDTEWTDTVILRPNTTYFFHLSANGYRGGGEFNLTVSKQGTAYEAQTKLPSAVVTAGSTDATAGEAQPGQYNVAAVDDTGVAYLRFTAAADAPFYRISVWNIDIPFTGHSHMLYVVDASGERVEDLSLDEDWENHVVVRPAAGETWQLQVKTGGGATSGRFAVALLPVADGAGDTLETALPLPAGQAVEETIAWRNDVDMFRLPDAKGLHLRLRTASERMHGEDVDMCVDYTVMDENGVVLAQDRVRDDGEVLAFDDWPDARILKVEHHWGDDIINLAFDMSLCTPTQHIADSKWKRTQEATCLLPGEEQRLCAVCGAACETREIAAMGHLAESSFTITKNATCEEAGEEQRRCRRCGETLETQSIPALGHQYAQEATVVRRATCEGEGLQGRVCSRCGEVTDVVTMPAPGHEYLWWTVKQEPTTEQEGYRVRTCSVCGHQERETLAKLTPFPWALVIVGGVLALGTAVVLLCRRGKKLAQGSAPATVSMPVAEATRQTQAQPQVQAYSATTRQAQAQPQVQAYNATTRQVQVQEQAYSVPARQAQEQAQAYNAMTRQVQEQAYSATVTQADTAPYVSMTPREEAPSITPPESAPSAEEQPPRRHRRTERYQNELPPTDRQA